MARKPLSLTGMPNLNQMLGEAERLGCTVAKVKSTGEVRVSHHLKPGQQLTLNARRKSGTRAMVAFLRDLQSREIDSQ